MQYNKCHKFIVNGNYIILNIVEDETVRVDYVVDCRQDYQWLIR